MSVLALLTALTVSAPPITVVHDSREASPLTSVRDTVPGTAHEPPTPAAYVRTVPRRGGGRWVQYWLFFADNPQDRGIVRTGRHEGDWELAQLALDAGGRPRELVLSQHSGGERCSATAPLRVYAAHGSHALYPSAGVRDRQWPDPNDEVDGRGRAVRPRLVAVTEREPPWMRYRGRFGASRASWVPGEQDSPRGPAFQPQGRWADPEGWAAAARPCTRCEELGECDAAESAMLVGALALVGGAAAFTLRRRRAN